MTTGLPRQQRRKLRRDLIERGRKTMTRGLPPSLTQDDAIGIALALHQTLTDQPGGGPARLADAAEALLDRTMSLLTKGLSYACRKGCGWCCWQRVIATAPEIFRVAEWLRQNAGRAGVLSLEEIRQRSASTQGFIASAAPGNQLPCPLLLDNACSIHPGRPLPCRAVLSMSADACKAAMLDPTTAGPVPLVVSALDTSEQVRTLMLAAVNARGLGDAGYDLVDALLHVLPDPAAEARWLSGENVFAAVRAIPRTGPAQTAQAQLVQMMAQLIEP